MCNRKSKVVVCILGALLAVSHAGVANGTQTTNYIPKYASPPTTTEDSIMYQSSDTIGIGTSSPTKSLHVALPDPTLRLEDTYSGNDYWDITNSAGSSLLLFTSSVGGANIMTLNPYGKVGIGTVAPDCTLDVRTGEPGGHASVKTCSSGIPSFVAVCTTNNVTTSLHSNGPANLGGVSTGNHDFAIFTNSVERMRLDTSGNVGIGTLTPSERLTVRGNVLIERSNGTAVLELGDGLDYAEGFDVTGADKPEPGTVLVIDSANPGQLTVSTEAYDTKVVGIAAGANNLGSGVRLGVGEFDCDVALAGRVYCNVDATECAIEPGDLLTTSHVPGYAMKAVDRVQRAGAVLGKAMQGLEKGQKGQILVFVTIQ